MSLELALVIIFGLAAGMMFLMALLGAKEEEQEKLTVQERIQQLAKGNTVTAESIQSQTSRDKALQKSFQDRVLFPVAQQVFEVTQGLIPVSGKSWIKTKLQQAGYTKPQYPKIFLGIQLLCCTVLFSGLLALTSLTDKVSPALGMFLAAFLGGAGYGLPLIWLIQQVEQRQKEIQKSLPDFIDLLVICVEAGLGLDLAIQKITQLKSVSMTPFLKDELVKYLRDIGFGRPRKQALQDLSNRVGLDDLTSVVNALIQAYEMGTGVAHTLRVQSDGLRVRRLQRAEEKANKIPVKMIIPIYVFLFPAIFVSMGGPLAVMMFKGVMGIFGSLDGMG